MMDTTPNNVEPEENTNPIFDNIEPSRMTHWNKTKEMIVLKGKIYRITGISHKKLTIKIHSTAPKGLADGVYTIREIQEQAGA